VRASCSMGSGEWGGWWGGDLGGGELVKWVMGWLSVLEEEVRELKASGLFRVPVDAGVRRSVMEAAARLGRPFLDVSSNDYLGYARVGFSRETLAALATHPAGAGSSRLIHGTHPAQDALERALARWVNLPQALLFSSGYAANSGTLAALTGPNDLIVSDALNHASIVDGCRLAPARVVVTPHRDTHAVERALRSSHAAHRWVVTESCFSMDGDTPDLPALRTICDRYGAALIVDEAHALGLYGPRGSGLCAAHAVHPDLLVGTLGKALGLQGAFVATDPLLRTWLWNRARSFVFSTGFSPLLAHLALHNLRRAQRDHRARTRLFRNATRLANSLLAARLQVPPTAGGPLLPLFLGDNSRALNAAARLHRSGILAQAIRPPTVPAGTARLRITLTATISARQLPYLARSLIHACSDSSS
jgi:8-amino-7-oxononanoate synthase